MNIRVHKISSVTYRLGFQKEVEVTDRIEPASGNAIVVRALREKRVYRELELASGRMATVSRGDVIVGVLGKRRAPRGFSGDVPPSVKVGDTVAILNRGGVIGRSTADHKDLGRPLVCEVLGMPVREGSIVRLADHAIPIVETLEGIRVPPIVLVSGTSMEAGKTLLLTALIKECSWRGLSVAGGKLTGIACLRDLVALEDHGARVTASFLDAGFPSTVDLAREQTARLARSVIAHLAASGTQAIFLELGDGILGQYGVMDVLTDPEVQASTKVHVFCAPDVVGAWGGHRLLTDRGVRVDLFSGPVTDNEVGVGYLEGQLATRAINAYRSPEKLAELVLEKLGIASDQRPRGEGGRKSSIS